MNKIKRRRRPHKRIHKEIHKKTKTKKTKTKQKKPQTTNTNNKTCQIIKLKKTQQSRIFQKKNSTNQCYPK